MTIKNINIQDYLTALDGDYVVVRKNFTGLWGVSKERCKKGCPPIGDARFRVKPESSLEDILQTLSFSRVPEDKIIIVS
jgi:hypothetical protein